MMDKLYNLTSVHWLAAPAGQAKSCGVGAGLHASSCPPLEDYGAILNFYFKTFYNLFFFLDLQDEHRLQELASAVGAGDGLEKVFWRRCCENFCTGGD